MLVAEFSCSFREIRQCLHFFFEVSKFSGVLVVDGLNKSAAKHRRDNQQTNRNICVIKMMEKLKLKPVVENGLMPQINNQT